MIPVPYKQAALLKKLVGIKRQKAEQDMLSLQLEVRRIEAEIIDLEQKLAALDRLGEGYDSVSLARRHGAAERIIAEIDRSRMKLAMRQGELGAAQEALKLALHSEDRIGEF